MVHILHLDTSPRGNKSFSRTLAKEFISDWKKICPSDIVTYRDLGHFPVPFITESCITAMNASPKQHTLEQADAIRLSNELLDEFLVADRYVFSIPMYNFSIPANFKAYIDQIVRIGHTFTLDADGYRGLVKNRKMLVITARGNRYLKKTPFYDYDMQEPYLRLIFGFMGITDIKMIHLDNLMGGDREKATALAYARAEIKQMITHW